VHSEVSRGIGAGYHPIMLQSSVSMPARKSCNMKTAAPVARWNGKCSRLQLRLRCACAAIAMRERCDIIAAQSQRTRIADQFPTATAIRRPCDVQPSIYTGCICVLNSKLLFVQTDIYVCCRPKIV
jgi:hypothetical protein